MGTSRSLGLNVRFLLTTVFSAFFVMLFSPPCFCGGFFPIQDLTKHPFYSAILEVLLFPPKAKKSFCI